MPSETDSGQARDRDRLIAERIRRKDYRRALELLAGSYAARLGRLCYAATGSQAEAEELVQEVLLAAYAAMPSFQGRSAVRTWLFAIARRACARSLEKRSRRARRLVLVVAGQEPAPPQDPLELAQAHAEHERLRQALGELSSPVQEVLLLRYAGGLPFREVAAACGISEEAARQRASSGLKRLRRDLEERSPPSEKADVAPAVQEMVP